MNYMGSAFVLSFFINETGRGAVEESLGAQFLC